MWNCLSVSTRKDTGVWQSLAHENVHLSLLGLQWENKKWHVKLVHQVWQILLWQSAQSKAKKFRSETRLIFFGEKNCLDFDRLSECHPQKENKCGWLSQNVFNLRKMTVLKQWVIFQTRSSKRFSRFSDVTTLQFSSWKKYLTNVWV